jgi:hypothetical protein
LVVHPANRATHITDLIRKCGALAYWPCFEVRPLKWSPTFEGVIPGLVFVLQWQRGRWGPIVADLGVQILRRATGELISIADADIQIIRHIEQQPLWPDVPSRSSAETEWQNRKGRHRDRRFKTGQKVRLLGDASDRWAAGQVLDFEKDGRVRIEIPFMGRMTLMRVLPEQLAAEDTQVALV